jgi:hypothetical protein
MTADSQVSSAQKSGLLIAAKGLDGLNLIYISLAAIICLTSWGTIFYKHTFEASRKENRLVFCDFAKYYVCGKLALSKEAGAAYDQGVQADYTVRYALGAPGVAEEYIHYPPMDFPLMAPLATLPIEQSYLAFCLGGSALLLGGTFLLSRSNPDFVSLFNLLFYWLAIFGSVPMFRSFSLGQTSVFLTGTMAFYLYGLLKNRPLLAGLALALTAIKPQYTLFLAIPPLVQRRYKLIIWAAIFELLMVLAAVATIGWQNVINYPKILLHSEQTVALAGAFVSEMVNVRGLLANVMDDSIAVKAAAFFALTAWLLLAWLWFKFAPAATKTTKETDLVGDGEIAQSIPTKTNLLLATTVLFALTFSPHTHLYDCCFIALPAVVAGRSSMTKALGESLPANKILAALLIFYPLAGWCFIFLPGTGAVHTVPFALYNLALCLAAAASLFSRAETQN